MSDVLQAPTRQLTRVFPFLTTDFVIFRLATVDTAGTAGAPGTAGARGTGARELRPSPDLLRSGLWLSVKWKTPIPAWQAKNILRELAIELAKTGITVNAICPGFVETPMLDRSIRNITAQTGKTTEEAAQALQRGNPQRRFIQTDEIAEAALWLCSDAAKSVNGHALSLSGGEI